MGIADVRFLPECILGILALYALLLAAISVALIRLRGRTLPVGQSDSRVTVVIPFKNEATVLHKLIHRCKGVPLPFLFVNDHSNDLSEKALDGIFSEAGLSLIHLPAHLSGKKAAIHLGAETVGDDWILTSDADTSLNPVFLQKLRGMLHGGKSAFVLPVRPKPSTGVVRAFFDIEFIVLQAVGCGAAASGFPLLANGAAFLFRKDAYFDSLALRDDFEIASGDDVFTLHAIASASGRKSVAVILPKGPAAEADFPEGITALWRQRLRWIGKAGAVKGTAYKSVIWLVFAANALFLAALVDAILSGSPDFFICAGLLKIGGEIFLTGWGVSYFRRRDCLGWILPGVIIYPFYFFALLVTALVHRPRWKQPARESVD